MASTELTKQEKEAKPQIKLGHYIIGENLGTGTFSKVKVGVHEVSGYKVAVKILNRQKIKSLDVVGKIRREILNLSLFRHPHIIRLYQVISTPSDIFMIMEHAAGGELFGYIVKNGRLTTSESRRFFQQIISGIDYCHRHLVVHRDLKPENLLLDENNNVKIVDFGFSNILSDGDFLQTSCGSPRYAAPEVISGKLYAGPEVDVWSCGVILYAMLCGSLPFDDDNVPILYRKIKSGIFTVPKYLDKPLEKLLCHMLEVDPLKRATIKDVINHEWFQEDLPVYLFPPACEAETSIVDIDAVRVVTERYHVPEEEVTAALLGDDPHHYLSIAYNLVVDHKRIADEKEGHDITGITSALKNTTLHNGHSGTNDASTSVHDKTDKWLLGIRSHSQPDDIMFEVFRIMKALDFEWKMLNSYHLIVRKRPDDPAFETPKLSLQLYQVVRGGYVLDFKSFVDEEACLTPSSRHPSVLMASKPKILESTESSQSTIDEECQNPAPKPDASISQTMQFFEMCATIIGTLTR